MCSRSFGVSESVLKSRIDSGPAELRRDFCRDFCSKLPFGADEAFHGELHFQTISGKIDGVVCRNSLSERGFADNLTS